MFVRIDEISSAGRRFDKGLEKEQLEELLGDAETGFHAKTGLEVGVRLRRAGERIVIEGEIKASLQADCKRCLGSIDLDLPISFRMDLLPLERRKSSVSSSIKDDNCEELDSDGSFSLEAADMDYYEGEKLDVLSILREQILLALPDYPLCVDECKGLCQVCGIDLNKTDCGCNREVIDPRWVDLSKIKIN